MNFNQARFHLKFASQWKSVEQLGVPWVIIRKNSRKEYIEGNGDSLSRVWMKKYTYK